jgi:hypothetical protein
MEINKSSKIGQNQSIQNDSPTPQTKPKLQLGIAMIVDTFETAGDEATSGKANSEPTTTLDQQKSRIGQNAMESLIGTFKSAIKDSNKDKNYFLEKLSEQNETADQLSCELAKLVDAAKEASDATAKSGKGAPAAITVKERESESTNSTKDEPRNKFEIRKKKG